MLMTFLGAALVLIGYMLGYKHASKEYPMPILPSKFRPETSLDRKLARVAREIAEAKPKGLSLDEFRFGKHEFNGAAGANERATGLVPNAADEAPAGPPSKPTEQATPAAGFKAGDRVRMRYKNGMECDGVILFASKMFPGEWECKPFSMNRPHGIFGADQLERIPSEPSPPTPVEGGWVLWHGGPTPEFNGKVRVKFADGFDTTAKEKWSDRAWAQEHIGRDADCNIVAFSWY